MQITTEISSADAPLAHSTDRPKEAADGAEFDVEIIASAARLGALAADWRALVCRRRASSVARDLHVPPVPRLPVPGFAASHL